MSLVHLEMRNDGILLVWLDQDGEKQNTLSPSGLEEFDGLVDRIEKDSAIEGVVLISRKDDFIAGADVRAISGMTQPGEGGGLSARGQELLARIEGSKVPVVAAVHGACLGGGLETALACRAIIASEDSRTQFALPEVQLGLIPGGGGTQRLPQRVGVLAALDMMLTGRRIPARKARSMGLVEGVVPKSMLLAAAIHRCRSSKARSPKRPLFTRLMEGPGKAMVFKKALAQVRSQTQGHYPAPEHIINCVRLGLVHGPEAGYRAERDAFDALVLSAPCKSLVRLFLEMTSRKKNPLKDQAVPVDTVAVVGAGLMGAGVATVTLRQGINVILRDRDAQGMQRGLRHVGASLEKRLRRKAITAGERDRALSRLRGTVDGEGQERAQVVIEAVFEELEVKHKVLAEAESRGDEQTIFASNTSALPISSIAEGAQRPENVIGMHYFSPVERMPLLEIIRGKQTADWVVATCYALGVKQGKTPIVVGDGPGFYTTRILAPYMNEAFLALEEGLGIQTLDRALVSWGFPVGPITLLDEVGIDVAAHVSEDLGAALAELRPGTISTLPQEFVRAGLLGRKSGGGFYQYEKPGAVARLVSGLRKGKTVHPKAQALMPRGKAFQGDAVERLVLAMCNEAARCLQEGVLGSAEDGDIGAILGLGFPPFRGGPFQYMDELGAANMVGRLRSLEEACGPRFQPAEVLMEQAEEGGSFLGGSES